MQSNKEIFLAILDNYIHPDHRLPEIKNLQVEDIEELFRLASEHSVFPVIYEQVRQTKAYQDLPNERKQYDKMKIKRLVIGQTCRTNLFLMLYKELLNLEIPMLVVKGLVCRNMYSNPDYRQSCDEDILIRKEDFHKLDQALEQRGFLREQIDHPEKEHEITFYNEAKGLYLEVHLSLFPEESGAYGRLNREFEDVFESYVIEKIQGVDIYTLDPTKHMLYLLCHGLKHFLHSGFGIRQLCDMVLFAEKYGDRIDWKQIEISTRRQHMELFWLNLFDIGENYLGFSWKKANLKKPKKIKLDSEAMLSDLLDSGVYGKSSEERVHSANITLEAVQSSKKRVSIRRSLFPSMEYMKMRYPYLKRHGWMLPYAWLERVFGYLKQNDRQEAMATVEMGKTRTELLRKYGIIDRQD